MATRPVAANGLGFSAAKADAELSRLGALYPLLADNAAIFSQWRQLVAAHAVLGKNAHDARLVVAMRVHGVTHLLTFNVADFSRYPGLTVLDAAGDLPPATP